MTDQDHTPLPWFEKVYTQMRCLKCDALLERYTDTAHSLAADMDAMSKEMVKHLDSGCSHRTDPIGEGEEVMPEEMTDQEHADALKSWVVGLRKAVRAAKAAGLDVKLTADSVGCTSGARVARNFYAADNADRAEVHEEEK